MAGVVLKDAAGVEVTSWRQYGQAKLERPRGLRVEEQSPPKGEGGWVLAGFWGSVDAVVVLRVGAIWKREEEGGKVQGGGLCANGSESEVSASVRSGAR